MHSTIQSQVTFDIDVLLNEAQPQSILLVGNITEDLTVEYQENRRLLGLACETRKLHWNKELLKHQQRYDLGIAMQPSDCFDTTVSRQILAFMRDALCAQFCVAVALEANATATEQLNHQDMIALALRPVAKYSHNKQRVGLYNYTISSYKKTPNWLNAKHWANPEMWGKYRW